MFVMLTFINCVKVTLSVGNKDDDPDRKVVLTEDANKFADQMGIQLFETSAKDNINVEEVWSSILLFSIPLFHNACLPDIKSNVRLQ